jgi:hypothetical protein
MGKAKYTINGKTALAVTTLGSFIDSAWKEYWFRQYGFAECDRIRDESAAFGKQVHTLIEKHLRKEDYELLSDDRVSTCAGLVIDWCKQADVRPLILPEQFGERAGTPAMEFEVKSEELLLVGHPDLFCTFSTMPTVWCGDWKSSKKMSLTYRMQVAAYVFCWREMTGQVIDDAFIVRVEKDPSAEQQFETLELHNLFDVYVPIVKEAKDIYDFLNRRGKYKGI